jgi:hypothetical protein
MSGYLTWPLLDEAARHPLCVAHPHYRTPLREYESAFQLKLILSRVFKPTNHGVRPQKDNSSHLLPMPHHPHALLGYLLWSQSGGSPRLEIEGLRLKWPIRLKIVTAGVLRSHQILFVVSFRLIQSDRLHLLIFTVSPSIA